MPAANQLVLRIIGAVLSLAAGAYYLQWSFGQTWWLRTDASYLGMWALIAITATIAVSLILSLFFAPPNQWFYPLLFSFPTFTLGALSLTFGEFHPASFWLALALITYFIAWSCGHVLRIVRSRSVAL
jgi:hypothetical protein